MKMSRTKSLRLTLQSGSAFVDGLEGLVKNVQFGNQLALPIKTKKDIDQQVKHGQALKIDKVKNRFEQMMIKGLCSNLQTAKPIVRSRWG